MAYSTNKSQQYKITEALISADRLGGFDALSFNVQNQIVEFNVFESLDKPYLTGSVAILDDKGLFDAIQFQGTELFRLSMASLQNDLDPIFQKEFYLTGVERSVKSNDNAKSSVYLFSFIEKHAFKSRLTKISRSFNSSLDFAITQIIGREFKKDTDISYYLSAEGEQVNPIQTRIKGIIPNLTPLQTIEWMLSRATTNTGSPFFCWSTIHDERLRFGNLDVMIKQKPFNSKLPYTYNPANVSTAEEAGDTEQGFTIKEIITKNQGNTYKLMDAGSVSANMGNTNLNTGLISNRHFSIRKTLEKLEKEGITEEKMQNVFDPDIKIDDVPLDDYDAMKYHTLTSSGTYGQYRSYHDEPDPTLFLKKLEGRAVKNHLFKNQYMAVVTGTAFFLAKASVGDMVRMKVVNDNSEVTLFSSEDDMLDKRKSGDFLIYDIRHTFQDTSHTVAMNLVKLERDK